MSGGNVLIINPKHLKMSNDELIAYRQKLEEEIDAVELLIFRKTPALQTSAKDNSRS